MQDPCCFRLEIADRCRRAQRRVIRIKIFWDGKAEQLRKLPMPLICRLGRKVRLQLFAGQSHRDQGDVDMVAGRIRMAHSNPSDLHRRKCHQLEQGYDNLEPERIFGAHSFRERERNVQISVSIAELAELLVGIVTPEEDDCSTNGFGAIAQDVMLDEARIRMMFSDRAHCQNPAHV